MKQNDRTRFVLCMFDKVQKLKTSLSISRYMGFTMAIGICSSNKPLTQLQIPVCNYVNMHLNQDILFFRKWGVIELPYLDIETASFLSDFIPVILIN